MAVEHELPRLRTRGGQAGAPHDVVEAALQHDDQVFAGVALGAHGLLKVIAELPLEQPVSAPYFLLFAQLQAVTHHLGAPRLPVLPWNEVALFDGALLRKAAQTFQKQLLPFPAAQAADGITMSCQRYFSFTSNNDQLPDCFAVLPIANSYCCSVSPTSKQYPSGSSIRNSPCLA